MGCGDNHKIWWIGGLKESKVVICVLLMNLIGFASLNLYEKMYALLGRCDKRVMRDESKRVRS